jgi:hypothetical protein
MRVQLVRTNTRCPATGSKVQYTDPRGRWVWIAYGAIAAVEFTDPPLIPPAKFSAASQSITTPGFYCGKWRRP